MGAGHVRAADAIAKTAAEKYPDLVVEHIDLMDCFSETVRSTLHHSYRLMMRRLPEVWRFIYRATNRPRASAQYHRLMKPVEIKACEPLLARIRAFAPDHIIATHPFPADVIRQAVGKEFPAVPFSVLLTDYGLHEFWLVPEAAYYFVATEQMRQMLSQRGIKNAVVSGIPIDPRFYEPQDTGALRTKYGIAQNDKVFLTLSGGQGLSHLDRIVQTMFESDDPIRIIAVAGNNERLESKLRRLRPPAHVNLTILGWTDAIHEYLALSDTVVSKPGGVTTTECVALGKPLIAIRPLPGQEEENIEYLLLHGYGVVAKNPEDLLYYMGQEPSSLAPGFKNKTPSEKPSAEIILDNF